MIATETFMEGLYKLTSPFYEDERGSLVESYVRSEFRQLNLNSAWATDVVSTSTHAGTVRGIHYQLGSGDLYKLVRVLAGAAFDVVVDLRRHSDTFGHHYACTLTGDGQALLVPPGCGHGFMTLSPHTVMLYKMSQPYMPELYRGIRWDSAGLDIPWPSHSDPVILSAQDASWPTLEAAEMP